MQTKHCECCIEFCVDVVAREVGCMAGHQLRFFKPVYDSAELPMNPTNNWGFKKKCKNFQPVRHREDMEDNKDSLKEIGYSYYGLYS